MTIPDDVREWTEKIAPGARHEYFLDEHGRLGCNITYEEKDFYCKTKIRYRKESAERARDHMSKKKGEAFDAYECDYCGGWHIGHRRQ